MPVKEADPRALELEDAFNAAMQGTAKPREVPSPPDIDTEAPHGRDPDGKPNAPFGYTKEGAVRKTAAGRKPNSDQPRTVAPGKIVDPKPAAAKAELEQRDYTGPLAEASEAIWVGATMISMTPLSSIPIIKGVPIGKDKETGLPRKLGQLLEGAEKKLAAQAHIFNANRGALVGALNIAANNSARARRLADKLEMGDATWVLMCGAMMFPFISQSSALWTGELEANELPTIEKMAEANQATFDGWIGRFAAQLDAATEAAVAGIAGTSGEQAA